MAKELVPVVLMMAMWGPLVSKQSVLLECDNLSLVSSINKATAKPPLVMHLLHSLWFFTAHYYTALTATHILGVTNTEVDQISRNQLSLFHQINPAASCSISAAITYPNITTENCFSSGTRLDLAKIQKAF